MNENNKTLANNSKISFYYTSEVTFLPHGTKDVHPITGSLNKKKGFFANVPEK